MAKVHLITEIESQFIYPVEGDTNILEVADQNGEDFLNVFVHRNER
jgi:hypothetical protein